jgi:transcription antitermination factor NusG
MHSSLAESSLHWFVVRVKPQHERAAQRALEVKGLESYVPLYVSRRRWSDRSKELELPLFPNYVFCRFERERRASVLGTPGVRGLVSFGDGPAPVSDREIESIQKAIASGQPLELCDYLSAGQEVRIKHGPLAGVEGVLLQIRDRWRVIVSVHLLQRSVAVEVDRSSVAAAAGARSMPAHA